MKKIIHPVGGVIAMLTIATFWLSTALSELSGSTAAIVAVKSAIPWGFFVLVPALMAASGSGLSMANGVRTGLVGTKLKRMPVLAALGLLVLLPAAAFLAFKAKAGEFDASFYVVESIELLAGLVNLTLLGLNMRDGFKMSGRLRRMKQASFEVALLGRETVADGTMMFRFAKPSGFSHVAGQSAMFEFTHPPQKDAGGPSRTFTIASAPHEPEMMIATRMRDTAFKRALRAMPLNSTVRITGPDGEMTLHDDPARPAMFLAGGIGITPFLAMARHASHAKLAHRITLFYSNRRPEDAAFIDELRQLEQTNPNFRLVATMTAPQGSAQPWSGEIGTIDQAMLRRYEPDIRAPIYYVAGPAAMVAAMQEMLAKAGVAASDVRSDEFYGY